MACRCMHVRVVIRNEKACPTTRRRLTPVPTMLDDVLSEKTVMAVFDDSESSLSAVERDLTARSRRAPSQAMLDSGVSQKSVTEDACWHPIRKRPRWDVLDDMLRPPFRENPRVRVVKSRSRRCLTSVRRQVHYWTVRDDSIQHLYSTGRCLTAAGHQAPLTRKRDDIVS
jgi:hypothetical protein